MSRQFKVDFSIKMAYYIEVNERSDERECNLRQQMAKHAPGGSVAFVQVGSNEISRLDVNLPIATLQDQVKKNAKEIVQICMETSTEHGITILVSELPPRYDSQTRSSLSQYFNASLNMEILQADPDFKLHNVNQQRLACEADKLRAERYGQDGVHLTKKGTTLLSHAWCQKLKEVMPELIDPVYTPETNDKETPKAPQGTQGNQDRMSVSSASSNSSGRGGARGRGGRRPGYDDSNGYLNRGDRRDRDQTRNNQDQRDQRDNFRTNYARGTNYGDW